MEPKTMITTYTTAPTDYDGFGTTTIAIVGTDRRNRPIRQVETPTAHVNWQRQRYGSGLHMAVDSTEWGKLVSFGLVNLEGTPTATE